ncbi:tRNA (adenosine(37)-N6)-threonylcarbamoyltransferase complex ATPase subunit type 1 TsaE [Candidatus Saccharibacteria bacterium]|nr:tRNA (adenosine(37)-N6)-threonylcarbamoyltransferase complex ATPase subunit type 1 TsaE [Candidatus Saccharibacteria bacterium]
MKILSEKEILDYGRQLGTGFLTRLKNGETVVVELLGDVGAGKTTLTRGIAEGLGVSTPVTSPSFTISKRYAFSMDEQEGVLIHYDFYRLPDPGLMSEELDENLNSPNTVVILEWADSVEGILPDNRIRIEIKYLDDGGREVITGGAKSFHAGGEHKEVADKSGDCLGGERKIFKATEEK